ncbi:MAG: DNA-formamidopyrimidine glycosylase, partial [Calditrichaeota bacterium]
MPELPEVETIRLGLQKSLIGQKIESILVRETRMRVPVDEAMLSEQLPGRTITDIGRRSKYVLMHLSGDKTLLVHLGMSGRIVLQAADDDFRKHDHIILNLVGGQQFRFHDPRRFGLVELVDTAGLQQHVRLKKLGLEPLDETTTTET